MQQNFFRYFTIVFLLTIGTANLFAQSTANYAFTYSNTGSLVDMSTGTTSMLAASTYHDDVASTVTNIGFTFTFMGAQYTQFSTNSNGQLRLGATVISGTAASSGAGVPLIAAMGGDNAIQINGKIHYRVDGAPGNRVLVVEWNDLRIPFSSTAGTGSLVQALLYEATGLIEFRYGTVFNNSTSTSARAIFFSSSNTANTVGYVTVGTVPTYTSAASAVTNTFAAGPLEVANLSSSADGSRWVYTFTPPATPSAPTALNFSAITSLGMTLNWTDNSLTESGFSVFRSTDGVNYSFITNVAADVVTYAATGLLPGQLYYWQVYAFSEGGVSAAASGNQSTNPAGALVSAGSGNWSSTATWVGGVVPTAGDNVTIAAGHTVTLDATGLICNALNIEGTLEYQATPLAGLIVNGNLTVANGGSFSAGTGTLFTHTLGIGGSNTFASAGSLINNGIIDLNTTAGVLTTFFGGLDGSISGSGTTSDFYFITVNKGTTRDGATLDVTIPITMSLVSSSTNRLVLTNGTFKISSASDITPAGGTQTIIAAGGRLWLNHASAVYNGTFAGSPTISGELRIDAGTFNYGSGNNTMTFSNTSTPGSVLNMNGGTINFLGAVSFSSDIDVQFNMSGGNFNVDPQATTLSTTATTFSIGASTTVNWSGGTVTIIDPRSTAGATAFSNTSTTNKIITGGKLRIGDGTSTTTGGALSSTSGFGLSLFGGVWDLEIDNRVDADNSRMARLTGTSTVLNNVEIKANSYLFLGSSTSSFTLQVAGNIINNGTLAGTEPNGVTFLGTLSWIGLGAQSLTGNGAFRNIGTMNFYNIGPGLRFSDLEYVEQNALLNQEAELSSQVKEMFTTYKAPSGFSMSPMLATITLANTDTLVVNRVNAFSGVLNPGSNFRVGRGTSIPIVQIGSGIVTDPGGSFTSIPTFDNVVGPSTYIYSLALGSHTTGAYNEMPAGPQTWTQVLINDGDGLFLDRPVTVNSFMTFTLGTINTTTTNLLTFVANTALTFSATSYVNGPFARVVPASTVAGTTLDFPIGKSVLRPLSLVDPVTTADGPVTIRAEVFDANSGGTPGTGMLALNTNRYWQANIIDGGGNFISTKVKLRENPLLVTDGIGKSSALTGVYDLVSSVSPVDTNITTDDMTSLSFFNIGERFTGPQNPSGVTATAISASQIDVAFTPNGASNNVVIVWNNTGTFTLPSGAPVVGNPLAGGTVLSIGTTSPVNHTGLNSGTGYFYKAFSYDGTDYSLGSTVVSASTFGSVPYSQDFEGTFPPAGWLNYGDKLWSTGSEAHGGLLAARVLYTPAGTANLQTMPFVLPLSPARIKFWWKDDDITARLGNGGSSDPEVAGHDTTWFEISNDGGTTWTILSFLSAPSNQSAYVEEVQNLTAYANQTVSFRWRDWSNGTGSAWGIGLDDITLELIPSCTEPSALTATNITTTSAQLGWTENGTATAWDIEYGPTPFTPTGTPTLSGVTNPYNLGGLSAATGYAYYVRANCGGTQSPWVGPYNFTTLCDVVLAPWNEDFELATFPPNCWSKSTTPTWDRSTLASGFGTGTASARANFYGISSTTPFHLTSFSFDASSMSTPRLKFDYAYATYTGGEVDQLDIYYSTDNGNTFTLLLAMPGGFAGPLNTGGSTSSSFVPLANQWATQTILLPAGTNMVRFMAISDFGNNLYVDNIAIQEAPSNDIGATNLALGSGLFEKTFTSEGQVKDLMSRSMINEIDGFNSKLNQNLSVTLMAPDNSNITDAAPVNFSVIVQNFGGVTENSYQVGWAINGVLQTSVSNTEPLEVGDADTLTLTWNTPISGLNSARAWTILATDTNPANDSSNTLSFYVIPDNVVFGEYFEEATFPPVGWLAVNADGGGTSGPWFQGNPTVFPAFEGSGYAGANFNGANGLYIDEWLITPNTGGLTEAGDSLTFWMRSPTGSIWPDSVQIRVSTTGTELADFTLQLDYFEVPVGVWTRFSYPLPTAASRYIAFRYLIYDANTNSNYIGLDAVEIIGEGGAQTFPLSVNIINGWNMTSVPGVHPTDQNVNTWWPNRNMLADVFKWTGTYATVTATNPTEGYWMLHTGDQTYNTGDEWPAGGIQTVAHAPIPLINGWNMVGGYEANIPVSGITTTPPGIIVPNTFYGWNGTYFNATDLVPGYGYWVLVSGGPGVINAPALKNGNGTIAKQDDRSSWGKILVTDATGKHFTLYSVNGEVNLDHYQMPPMPPAGAFDVRYSSNRLAEDIKTSGQTIEMNGMVYPVTVRIENANVRLQDETGRIVNTRLKDGEEYVINNSQVSKLKVSENLIPDVYALDQNYPNPFNPSTIIRFSLPEDVANVTVTIYNALGQKVTELVNSKLEAGQYEYRWNAKDVASGLYIYELRTEKFSSVKKMMLLK